MQLSVKALYSIPSTTHTHTPQLVPRVPITVEMYSVLFVDMSFFHLSLGLRGERWNCSHQVKWWGVRRGEGKAFSWTKAKYFAKASVWC